MLACPRKARSEVSIMKHTRTARPANVTDTSIARDAVMPAVFMAPGAARTGRNADWAVTELYSLHYQPLVRLATLLVRDIPTAEDVVQDSFVAMHEGWHRLRNAESALAYLRHAVLNRSRSVLRHRVVVDKHPPNPPPDHPSAEYGALMRLEQSTVVAALRRLPGRQREAIVLRYYADFSEAQTAAAMGISCGAVKSHTARAMAALRADLEQQDRAWKL
jgi:RNA polymerase sigma-70 factor (sigma-E family)